MSTFLGNGLYQIVKDPNACFNKNKKVFAAVLWKKLKTHLLVFVYQNKSLIFKLYQNNLTRLYILTQVHVW